MNYETGRGAGILGRRSGLIWHKSLQNYTKSGHFWTVQRAHVMECEHEGAKKEFFGVGSSLFRARMLLNVT